MKIDTNKYYIVRGDRSGVFFGRINYQDGKEVQMNDVRCIWYWDGAASIVELAHNGVKYPESCPDRPKKYMRMMECVALKYARLLYEAGLTYTEEDVWSAYNGGYACGMEQGIEAERSRKG